MQRIMNYLNYFLIAGLTLLSGRAHAAYTSADSTSENSKIDQELFQAAGEGDLEEVRNLIANGANINYFNGGKGWTPLTHAARNGHAEVVATLIAAGADVNAKKHDDDITPLHAASENGYDNIVAMLLAAGADVNAQDFEKNTSLRYASQEGYDKVVAMLIAAGADLEIKDYYGQTPLQLASRLGKDTTTELLLAAGADIDAQDIHGDTALSLASKGWLSLASSKRGRTAVVNILLAQKLQQLEAMPAYEWQTAKRERNEIKGASLAAPSAKRQR